MANLRGVARQATPDISTPLMLQTIHAQRARETELEAAIEALEHAVAVEREAARLASRERARAKQLAHNLESRVNSLEALVEAKDAEIFRLRGLLGSTPHELVAAKAAAGDVKKALREMAGRLLEMSR